MALPGMRPSAPERPQVEGSGTALRISWSIPETDPEVTASAIKIRIKGSSRLYNYDHGTGKLVPKGGSTVPAPLCSVTVEGCEEGIEYEAVLAVMNSEGWSEPSPFSEPGFYGDLKERAKPEPPAPPKLTTLGSGKLRCSWALTTACPPVEATQVRLTDVGTGKSMLIDATNGKLVESGRTTFAASRTEVTLVGIQDCVEYTAAICCRNAEGFGEYSLPSDSVANIDAKAQPGGMALVIHEGPSAEVPVMVPLGEGKMKVRWTLPDEAKSTIVKLRRVGNNNWYLCGGSAIPAPATETVATGLEEGIEYEAIVSFLINNRWCCESEISKPACIGDIKLPGVPDAPKEPRLYVMDVGQGIMRVKWQYTTCVPPVTGSLVRFRAVGARHWLFAHPSSGALLEATVEKDPEMIPVAQSEVDLRGLPLGIRFEAQVAFRNKLGLGPYSKESEIGHIGLLAPRPLKCTYCFQDFDLQTAEYTKNAETFWCPMCRFRQMDPFNAVVEPYGVLKFQIVMRPNCSFNLDLPDLKAWRKEDQSIWLRMVRINSENCAQVWPQKISMIANGAEVFKILPPEEGHVRRDVPIDISASLRPGMNSIAISMDDDHVASFVWCLVRTQSKTAEQIAAETPTCEEEDAKKRVVTLLADTKRNEENAELDVDHDEDEVTCVLSNKLKLLCPLSFLRVELPVRGEQCMHLQCFGLEAYLQSNMKMKALNNRWTCPVCSNILKPQDLRVDAYVQKVLDETPSYIEEVLINQDGSYRVIDEDGEDQDKEAMAAAAAAERREREAEESKAKNSEPVEEDGVEMQELPTTIDDGDDKKKRKKDDTAEIRLTKRQRRRQQKMAAMSARDPNDSD